MKEITFEITRPIAVLSQSRKGTLELNLVSWNNKTPKYDLRTWGPDQQAYKGLTLTDEEARSLYEALKQEFSAS